MRILVNGQELTTADYNDIESKIQAAKETDLVAWNKLYLPLQIGWFNKLRHYLGLREKKV
ncbi:MAG: hypothetical protein H6Q73_1750 [Firmicutes bacterium]|nr:hypothetical protein [Bacillota bacterium]